MPTHLNEKSPPPRLYQSAIAESVLKKGSSLVVLPTGMGKTLLALIVADKMLEKGNILFLAPTRPLAEQHEKTIREWINLPPEKIVFVSGLTSAGKRPQVYATKPKILISTPQTIANDLEAKRLEWDFALVIFDEVHRAVGKYAYTKVAQTAKEKGTMVLGLTASPGGQKKKIEDMLEILCIKNVEIRTAEDEDVKPYIMPLEITWIEVKLTPEIMEIKKTLEKMILEKSETLKKMGFYTRFNTKKGMAELRAKILSSNSRLKYSALSYHATLFSLIHVLELLETQGIEALTKFITKVKAREESKAQQRLLNDVRFKEIEEKLKSCAEHPKIARLVQMIKERPAGEKFIVFSQYRDQVQVLHEAMQKEGLRSKPFMGKKDGFTQKEQAKTIEDFRKNEFDILVSTSIGEEGLDIPSVDNVVFYEPVPSEIRSIQRRGRAGRAKLGRMFGLIATGTRDQAFFWSAKKREEKMKRIVKKMSGREEEEFQKVWTNKNTGKESGELKDEEIKHAKEKSLKEKETDEKAQNKKQDENKKINSPEDKKQNESVDKKQGSDKTKNSSQDKKHKKGQYRLSDFE